MGEIEKLPNHAGEMNGEIVNGCLVSNGISQVLASYQIL